jgi:8-oxo-dGTP diphosphatase
MGTVFGIIPGTVLFCIMGVIMLSSERPYRPVDFTVAAFLVHGYSVLFVFHKSINAWLCVGGHIEDDETPEEALLREIYEETGKREITLDDVYRHLVASTYPTGKAHNSRQLLEPVYVDLHDVPPMPGHRHVALVYYLRALSKDVELEECAHSDYRWWRLAELEGRPSEILPSMCWYGVNAITKVSQADKGSFGPVTMQSEFL